MKTRFAPSPSGHLHVGGARTALFSFAFARRMGGRFILRIEDTDQKRSSDSASVGFLKDLAWLGITWDEGPVWVGPLGDGTAGSGDRTLGGGADGPYFQSERLDLYNAELERLIAQRKAYHAFDSAEELDARRREAQAAKRPYRYDGSAFDLAESKVRELLASGRPSVVRLRVPAGAVTIRDAVLGEATVPAGEIDDFVLRKADGFPTYHFAVVVDDAAMGVTHVLRAQEHFNNTAKHMLIQDALGYSRPAYAHLPLITNPDGSKMSKRDKDKLLRATVRERGLAAAPTGTVAAETWQAWLVDPNRQLDFEDALRLAAALAIELPEINVDDFRRSGYLPEVLVNFLSLNGWSPGGDREKFDLDFICANFALERVLRTPAKFDRAKLLAFNVDAIRALPRAEFLARVRRHGAEYHPGFMARLTPEQFDLLMNASHERSRTLDEPFRGARWALAADAALGWEESKPVRKALAAGAPGAPGGLDHLAALVAVLRGVEPWTVAALEAAVTAYSNDHAGGQIGKVAQPLRIAVTGGTVSPPIFDTLAILGQASTLARIERCVAWAGGAGGAGQGATGSGPT